MGNDEWNRSLCKDLSIAVFSGIVWIVVGKKVGRKIVSVIVISFEKFELKRIVENNKLIFHIIGVLKIFLYNRKLPVDNRNYNGFTRSSWQCAFKFFKYFLDTQFMNATRKCERLELSNHPFENPKNIFHPLSFHINPSYIKATKSRDE